MQTLGKNWTLIRVFLAVSICIGCNNGSTDSFDRAIAKHRSTLVDQVNPVGQGIPYFTTGTLNPVWHVTPETPIVTIPPLQLLDQDGQKQTAALFTNKISLVGFFFASCSGFCPYLMNNLRKVAKELHAPNTKVQFVAFSVNPDEDSPAQLKEFATRHTLASTGSWTLLTGNKATIYNLAKQTLASQVFKRPGVEANFVHSEHIYVIDGKLRLRGILNGTRVDLAKDAKAIVTSLLKESDENMVGANTSAERNKL